MQADSLPSRDPPAKPILTIASQYVWEKVTRFNNSSEFQLSTSVLPMMLKVLDVKLVQSLLAG